MSGINKTALYMCCFILILLWSGCRRYSPEMLVKNYRNICNIKKVLKRNGAVLTIEPVPAEYLASREYTADTSKNLGILVEKYENALYFNITASRENKAIQPLVMVNPAGRLQNDITQLLFSKNNDFVLIYKTDTVKAEQCQFERDWAGGDGSFFVAFRRSDFKYKIAKYSLTIRNLWDELGTVSLAVPLYTKKIALKGI